MAQLNIKQISLISHNEELKMVQCFQFELGDNCSNIDYWRLKYGVLLLRHQHMYININRIKEHQSNNGIIEWPSWNRKLLYIDNIKKSIFHIIVGPYSNFQLPFRHQSLKPRDILLGFFGIHIVQVRGSYHEGKNLNKRENEIVLSG